MMGDSVRSGARLEVSVSFGRFEGDDLSWEKWSSFSQNKYLEEVGTLSTPGSVAQKKAYFEAHYKKIAARKLEELVQEKSMDHVQNSSTDANLGLVTGDGVVEEVAEEEYKTDLGNTEAEDDNAGCCEGVVQEVPTDCLRKVVDAEGGEVGPEFVTNDELNVGNEVDLDLSVKNPTKDDSQKTEGEALERENGGEKPNSTNKARSNLSSRDVAQKVTQNQKEKAVIPAVKPLSSSTPRQAKAKAKPNPVPVSSVKSLQKKSNGSALPKGKTPVSGESKRGSAAASLHMSMNLGLANSSPMIRKSLIMEKQQDKDIVKQAFKTIHNRTNAYSTNKRMQVPSTVHLVHTNANAGIRKDSEKNAVQKNQSGSRSKPFPSESHRSSGPEKKNTVALTPSIVLRSNVRAEKRKEFLKKLEAKSIAREAENAQLNAKSKEEKESEIRKLRQSLNFKAKPLPSFYRDQRKAHLEKESEDNEVHH